MWEHLGIQKPVEDAVRSEEQRVDFERAVFAMDVLRGWWLNRYLFVVDAGTVSGESRRNMRRKLRLIKVGQLLTPNGTIFQASPVDLETLNILQKLEIYPPWKPRIITDREGNRYYKKNNIERFLDSNDEGYENLIFHDLRRTALRNMIRAGVLKQVAGMISGRRTDGVFARYDIVSERDLREAVKSVQMYLE